jgi:integrase
MGRKKKKVGHQINGRGSLRIDRVFRGGVGRIARASGTRSPDTLDQINKMLSVLAEQGKFAILNEVKTGKENPLEVFQKYSRGELKYLQSTASLRPLFETYKDWLVTHRNTRSGAPVTASTQTNYRGLVSRFVRDVGDIPIADVPVALRRYRETCEQRGFGREFNYLRTALGAFITSQFPGEPLQAELRAVRKLPEPPKRVAPQLGVPEAARLLAALDPDARDAARTMLFSGMNWKELAGSWEVVLIGGTTHAIAINGTKTANRPRLVPLFDKRMVFPTISNAVFRRRLRKVDSRLSPMTFRRTFARWLADCSIPAYRRQHYMGHLPSTMTERYEMGEVLGWFAADVRALHNYLEENRSPVSKPKPEAPKVSGFSLQLPR